MFNKRLISMVPQAMRYNLCNVAAQWTALVANVVLMLLIGLFLQRLFDGVAVDGWVVMLLGAGVAVIAVRMVCLTYAQRMGVAAAAAAKRSVRRQVYDKLVRMGPGYSERIATSEAVQVSVEGCEQLESYFGQYLPQLLYAVLAPLTVFAFLAPLCLPAAVALLVCVPLIPISIVAVQKIAKRVMGRYWGAYTDLGGVFLENLQGLTTLKIYQADEACHRQMNEQAESFRRATMRLLTMQLNSITVMDVFAFGGAAVGIIAAMVQFANGQVPFYAAFCVVFLSAEFFLPMRALGSFFHTAMNGMAVAEKMFAILDAPEPERGTRSVDPARAGIVVRDVSYSYDGQRTVLDHVDFAAPAGSFTGIVGESSSGKSTLAGILCGRNRGFEGDVEIGGVPLGEVSRESMAQTVTVVPFSSYLFSGTVRSNLLMACPEATDDELWDVLRRCRIDGFVRASGGLDALVSEQGGNFSGGQRQRLALARALLHDTPVYIFDEATSNVDADSEQAIVGVIHELAKSRTVIMISHRLASVAKADRIFVLENGRVAESGSHEQLCGADGAYAKLWGRQMGLEAFASQAERRTAGIGEAGESQSAGIDSTVAHASQPPMRPRSNLSIMCRMVKLVKPLVPVMIAAVIMGVVGFLCAIFLTVGAALVLTGIAGFEPALRVGAGIVLVAACGLLRGPLHYGEQMCNHYLAFKILALVRDRVFGKLRTLAPAKLEGRSKGDLVSLVTSDVELLEVFYAHTLSPVLIAVLVCAVMIAFIGSVCWQLAISAFVAYVLVGIAAPWAASRAAGDGGRELRDALGGMNSFVLDSLRGLRETLQFGQEHARSEQLDARMDSLSKVERRLKSRAARSMAATNGLVLALDVAMVALACVLCAQGVIDSGQAFVCVAALMSSFGPVIAVANLGSGLQQTLASGARVLDLLDEQPQTREIVDGCKADSFSGAAAEHVGFSYGGSPVLKDVTLEVAPGSIVHLAGRSGSGKSTLCKLFMRFWDPSDGCIRISGQDIRDVSTDSLRAIEGYMTQETHLFSGTVGDNIALAKPDAAPEELMRACEKAALTGLIERLPQGLDTPVGELGDTLSGGERQRIGLARMFLHDAPFVLLDEPTSNLDSLNEAAVLRALLEARQGKTVVLVSHRASTAAICDASYTVERGRLS
ncbi:thiol reductant ABC exporter subunit CydC [Senegalimassilia anaerobia]